MTPTPLHFSDRELALLDAAARRKLADARRQVRQANARRELDHLARAASTRDEYQALHERLTAELQRRGAWEDRQAPRRDQHRTDKETP